MGVRSLSDTFRFSYRLVIIFLALLLFVAVFSGTSYALTPWFTVKDGGVLSGTSGTGVSATIPSSSQLPHLFVSVLIQGSGVGSDPKPDVGSIFVTGDKSVKTGGSDTKDAYIKGIGLLPAPSFFSSLKQIAKPFTGSCPNMLATAVLKPSDLVYTVSKGCLEGAINSLSGGYKLDGDGVVILYVTGTVLNINKDLKSNSINQRLVIISESEIRVGENVGYSQSSITVPESYYDSSAPNVQASLVSLSSDGITIKSTANISTEKALIMEGPMYSNSAVSLKRELPLIPLTTGYNYPGVYIKYNPFYVAKLTEQLRSSGVSTLGSGVRWLYD